MKWTTKEGYIEIETLRVFIVADTISELPVPLKDILWTNVSMGTVEGVMVNGRMINFEDAVTVTTGMTLEVNFDGLFTVA